MEEGRKLPSDLGSIRIADGGFDYCRPGSNE